MKTGVVQFKIKRIIGRKLKAHECIQIANLCNMYGAENVYQAIDNIDVNIAYLKNLKKFLSEMIIEPKEHTTETLGDMINEIKKH